MPHAVVLNEMPAKITAGESMSWKWSNSTFPAPSWTLVYTLVIAGEQKQITASASGSDHLVEVTSATTSAYAVGEYAWQAHVSKGDERKKVGQGRITVESDFATESGGHDARSHVKKVLDALNALLEGRVTKTQVEQTTRGVSVRHKTDAEIVQLRDRYAIRYNKELAQLRGQSSTRSTTARFRN